MLLTGKKIVITGGTSGIGLELVKQLYRDNQLIIIGRNEDKLKALNMPLRKLCFLGADLSVPLQVEAVADQITKIYQDVDILINNAAVQYTPQFLDDDFLYESIGREVQINFIAVCQLSYLLLPLLLKASPSIILNVNSGLGLAPKTSSSVYCATKAALDAFSRSLSYQLEKTNIDVMQAFMPLVDTPMTKGRGEGKMSAADAARHIIYGLESEKKCHDIGKVKLLRLFLRLWPSLGYNILKRA